MNVGIAFDGTNLLVSCVSGDGVGHTYIDYIKPSDGSLVKSLQVNLPGVAAIAYDAGRGMLWACDSPTGGNSPGSGTEVYLIDLSTGNATDEFATAGCWDGLAYDASDDTLWTSPDQSNTIYHYKTDGTQIASYTGLTAELGGYGNSGVAVGGSLLYLSNADGGTVYTSPKDFSSPPTAVATESGQHIEDMECDSATFAPKDAMWVISAFDRTLNAYEIPAGSCGIGGQPAAPATTLTVNAATGDFADPTSVSAVLTNTNTSAPISGESVTLTLNGSESCTGTTDASGTATCSLTPGEAAGPYTLAGSFGGGSSYQASSGSAAFTVTLEETALSYTGDSSAVNGQPMTLSAVLTTDDPSAGTPLAGKTVDFTLGSGGTAQTCSGTTDATGTASCTIASVSQSVGSVSVAAGFAADSYYQPSSASSSVSVFAPPATGAFVVGDLSAGSLSAGTPVYFWGSQWWKQNTLSGGRAPSSMKGFADSPQALTCGSTWSTDTGNSSAPPSTLPGQIEVIVSGNLSQDGSTISGTVDHIVLVGVGPGYMNDPGHPGTGTILSTLC